MFKRMRLFAKSYLESKEQEYTGYVASGSARIQGNPYGSPEPGAPEQRESSGYEVWSPHSSGQAARQQAEYAGKGEMGKTAANVYGHISAFAHNLETWNRIGEELRKEEELDRAEEEPERSSRTPRTRR